MVWIPFKFLWLASLVCTFLFAQPLAGADFTGLVAQAEALVSKGSGQAAIPLLDEAIALQPGAPEGYFRRGLAWHALVKRERAADDFTEALRHDPRHAPSLARRALVRLELRELDAAVADAQAAVASNPKEAYGHYVLGRLAQMPGRHNPQEAVAHLTRAIEADPMLAVAYSARGSGMRSRDPAKALNDHNRALELMPGDGHFYAARSLTLEALNQPDPAIVDLDRAIEIFPQNTEYLRRRASIHFNQGRIDMALRQVNAILALKKDDPGASLIRGVILRKKGRLDEAQDAMDRAIRTSPTYSVALKERALLWIERGDSLKALRDATEAVKISPEWVDVSSLRATTLLALGRTGEARDEAGRALGLAGWESKQSPYLALVAYLGERQARPGRAAKFMQEMAGQWAGQEWPRPVFNFLLGKQTPTQLIAGAIGNDQITEARAYIGLMALIEGRQAEAVDHLQWVRDNGDPTFTEHHLAVAALQRLTAPALPATVPSP